LLDEVEAGVRVAAAEEALAVAQQDREHEQVVAVDQAGGGQALREGGADVHDDVAAVGLLERGLDTRPAAPGATQPPEGTEEGEVSMRLQRVTSRP
jgi:hypothetical protein